MLLRRLYLLLLLVLLEGLTVVVSCCRPGLLLLLLLQSPAGHNQGWSPAAPCSAQPNRKLVGDRHRGKISTAVISLRYRVPVPTNER